MTTALGFDLLGPLQVTVGGTPVAPGTPKQRAVLAVLLINRNRTVSADGLIDAVWEESPAAAARASLHSYVSNLRRLLGGGQGVLANSPPGYRLNVTEGACDLDRFLAEKSAGLQAAAAGNFEEAGSRLFSALSQWRGPVLDDLRDFTFTEAFAAALTEDKVLAQTARAEAEIACGRAASVISELEKLVAEHPYREPLWVQLITAYYVDERQSDALAAHRRLKRLLADDLGIDPGPTVNELNERILRQDRLDVGQAAKATAIHTLTTSRGDESAVAALRDGAGHRHVLRRAATRIGRLPDNDIVLNDPDVSRHHAVIVDTGSSLVITDVRSANGVHVQGQRLRPSATLADGDRIVICGHEFTVEIDR
ncbi:BTAD domain-containing putative transcriptional regulator [Mycobacterium sp. EPa45]|uniref:BTAD domain-containing putative transcriptional regulator n=1 Tax=Mycobacterium sp. EPa45 TaxID=1545728 RepID=UPI000641B9A2|nr:BTAD domain-containing putative transcriptional regulator [Mycobacterium sp. EPa45]AKK28319.1 regulator [Mycobacterium sp. EPa45]